VASPSPTHSAGMEGWVAGSHGSAWAVFYYTASGLGTSSAVDRALIAHWNGRSWLRAPSPSARDALSGVGTAPGGGARVVGYYCGPAPGGGCYAQTLVLDWTGAGWSRVASPNPGTNPTLSAVSAGPAGAAWAVGGSFDGAVILHWDGATWSQVASPSPGRRAFLYDVSTAPDGTAWAVGNFCASACGTSSELHRTLILRFDGATWRRVTSPSPGRSAFLTGVAVGPDGTGWAVGYSCTSGCDTVSEVDRTVILRWDGTAWSGVASPSPGRSAILNGVSVAPSGGAWAVGSSDGRTLLLRWNGTAWVAG